MTTRPKNTVRHPLTACAFGLAIVSCVLGLLLCVVKSPQAKSADYLLLSRQALNNDPELASSAAWEAARLNPSSPEAWDILARSLDEKGDRDTAERARVIALRLHKNPGQSMPVYATPAQLRLSLLASANGDL